ncbi:hypothetical protein K488DRAFT_75108 [Vararia minispora EC-137]|uniref:Uncharacterized protein n=1 Tax=Vararia minispora EC-137 TaxID=1314806 RepID=A0ACB8Q589_9AGAM|nr:hypothetical protein K488DRAFT_75108 [Vararia minispora EC-137]
MGNARAALSGLWVLHFIMLHSSTADPSWTEGDLNIYCPEEGLPIIMSHLHEEGYYPSRTQEQDLPSKTFMKGIITRVLKFDQEERGLKVDVVCTRASTPFEVVLEFWTTLVMNVVTVHDLTILYPDLTLAKQGRQPLDRARRGGVGELINKYIGRGFQVWPFSRQQACTYEPNETRSTRDTRCLVLPIATPDGYMRGPQGSTLTVWRMRGYGPGDVNGSIAYVESIIGPFKKSMLRGDATLRRSRPTKSRKLPYEREAHPVVGAEWSDQEGHSARGRLVRLSGHQIRKDAPCRSTALNDQNRRDAPRRDLVKALRRR